MFIYLLFVLSFPHLIGYDKNYTLCNLIKLNFASIKNRKKT